MVAFFPGQKWTSEGEPELGVGSVKETSKGRVTVCFLKANEIRMYATAEAPLRRVVFKAGETIMDQSGTAFLIESVREGDLFLYIGKEGVLSEADLGDVTIRHGVDDKLLMGDVGSPQQFSLRRKALLYDYQRKTSPVNGFLGGRIDLIPHQLYIAHELSSRYAPRVLLSDQVGLGKTIEACLIIHRLLLSGRATRVLILVPDSLVHQWFVELLRKFNLWFHIFDEDRCSAIEEGVADGNPFLDDQLIICSTSFLANSKQRTLQALESNWDLLVVDEAHHLEWSVDEVSKDYSVVELLSKAVKGLLLLTATPEQLGAESHFARLRLLDPDRYGDFDTFNNESQDTTTIANLVEKLSSGQKLTNNESQLLQVLFNESKVSYLDNEVKRNHLIEDLLDQHGPGRVIFRNTRAAMQGFPKRKAFLEVINQVANSKEWVDLVSKEYHEEVKGDARLESSKGLFGKNDPRVKWLIEKLEALSPQKALLICKSKKKVLALEKVLSVESISKVGVFHEELTIVQRDRNAAWFAEKEGCQLLLCSEIGSEGRNFQFAHHLILFDLPSHPELLEQRIGRLDRIGQTEDIKIHIPYLRGTPQEVVALWYQRGLNAFEENIEGGDQVFQKFAKRLVKCALTSSLDSRKLQLEELIKETFSYQKGLKKRLADGRDRLLEMNSFRPKKANELIAKIQEADFDRSLEYFMTNVFDNFGIEMEDLATRSYLLRPSRVNNETFPSVPDQGVSVTFDRSKALIREDLSFISWDHPMATGALDMILSAGVGSTSFGVIRAEGEPTILLEVLFVLNVVGGRDAEVDRFLPNTPLRVVVNHKGEEVTDFYSKQYIDQHIVPASIDEILENEAFVEVLFPNMIVSAANFAEKLGEKETSKGFKNMSATLNHEVDRLQSLQKYNNHIRSEEIELAIEEKSKLEKLINGATVRMDAIQLIQKGSF